MNNTSFEDIYAGLIIKEWKNVGIEDRKNILEKARYKSFVEGRKNSLSAASFSIILAMYFILFGLVPVMYWETYLIVPISAVLTAIFSPVTYSFVNFLIIKREILSTLKNEFSE